MLNVPAAAFPAPGSQQRAARGGRSKVPRSGLALCPARGGAAEGTQDRCLAGRLAGPAGDKGNPVRGRGRQRAPPPGQSLWGEGLWCGGRAGRS